MAEGRLSAAIADMGRSILSARAGLALLLLLAAGEALAAGDAALGREVAERVCSRCHVVSAAKPYGGIDSTPSFFLMSEQLEDYRPRVLTLKGRPPHKALDLDELSNDDLKDLVAYIGSLERP
jgi:mono/diheme cytochrome c family protein